MQDKIALVTGANSGMGLATTVALAKQGAHVIMLCRSRQRGELALAQAREQSGSARIELMLCDLGSLSSIRAFAEAFLEKHGILDVLVNNAGIFSTKRQTTADGFEAMMGINHLGHFLLTNLLLDAILRAPQGRIVNVSSGSHKSGRFDFTNPYLTKGFSVWRGYAQSKLANIWFTRELATRLAGTTATANSLHPGSRQHEHRRRSRYRLRQGYPRRVASILPHIGAGRGDGYLFGFGPGGSYSQWGVFLQKESGGNISESEG